jgi:translation initiation factor 6
MGHAIKLSFNGDPNIGMYGIATDSFCILGQSVQKKYIDKIKKTLGVPVYQIKLYGTDLVGIFAVGNSNGIIVPDVIFDSERKALKKLPIKVHIMKTQHTALTNNILCNDKIAFVSKEYSEEEVKEIGKALGVKVIQAEVAGTPLPGSCGTLTNKGAIFNQDADDAEIKKIEKALGQEVGLGTINMGNGFIGSGVIANSNGFLAGKLTSGFEIVRVDESLGFLD